MTNRRASHKPENTQKLNALPTAGKSTTKTIFKNIFQGFSVADCRQGHQLRKNEVSASRPAGARQMRTTSHQVHGRARRRAHPDTGRAHNQTGACHGQQRMPMLTQVRQPSSIKEVCKQMLHRASRRPTRCLPLRQWRTAPAAPASEWRGRASCPAPATRRFRRECRRRCRARHPSSR